MSHQLALILDFGSQFNQLIARRVREAGVYSEIVPCDITAQEVRRRAPHALIFSGGPASVYDEGAPKFDPEILKIGLPVLGICYGLQIIVETLGGKIQPHHAREYGKAEVTLADPEHPLVKGLPSANWTVWMSHGDQAQRLPEGFQCIGGSATCPNAIVADDRRKIWGLQFHPEVTHTQQGAQVIRNFLFPLAGFKGDWTGESFVEESVERIRREVPDGSVILGLSGGVDSSVAAALLHRALGGRLACIFVDNGLLRKGEAEQVRETFGRHFHMQLHSVDASEMFLSRLEGVGDPEKKRKIIGATFIDVFEAEAKKIPDARWLAQGTIYPDVIESTSAKGGPSAKIKSHHNVGGLPERMNLKIVEPLRELFKDEVRSVGKLLGLPRELVDRHPFPGPGLAVRIPGAVTRHAADVLREADAIFIEELHRNNLYHEIAQAFAVFLPVRSVGVMGDGRTYENVIALRAVRTQDFMTADAFPIEHPLLARIATRIVNEVRGVNRVVYDITSKPPATIEWE